MKSLDRRWNTVVLRLMGFVGGFWRVIYKVGILPFLLLGVEVGGSDMLRGCGVVMTVVGHVVGKKGSEVSIFMGSESSGLSFWNCASGLFGEL